MIREFLLIDDDADELEIICDALLEVDKDIQCAQVKNLAEASEWLASNSPDYVFIDYNMPKTNGLELLTELKRDDKLENSRVVLYSNHITEEMQKNAKQLGAYCCIKKPPLIKALVEALREVLK
jgi:DNA-binding NtrC family response regulator